jgi:hypothetical protein
MILRTVALARRMPTLKYSLAVLASAVPLFVIIALLSGFSATQIHQLPRSQTSVIGTKVSLLSLVDVDGRSVMLDLTSSNKPTVLYVFAKACRLCELNLTGIKQLARVRRSTYSFVGVSLQAFELKKYIASRKFPFVVYSSPSNPGAEALQLGNVPQTIVLSRTGEVIRNWNGTFEEEVKNQIEEYFDTKLPEIQSPKSVDNETGGAAGPISNERYCSFCVWDGTIYSSGAVVSSNPTRLRCKAPRWEPY